MSAEWYYQVMGEVVGPMSASELKRLALAGEIRVDTLVRKGDEGNWVLAERVKGLPTSTEREPARTPRTSPGKTTSSPAQASRTPYQAVSPSPAPAREEAVPSPNSMRAKRKDLIDGVGQPTTSNFISLCWWMAQLAEATLAIDVPLLRWLRPRAVFAFIGFFLFGSFAIFVVLSSLLISIFRVETPLVEVSLYGCYEPWLLASFDEALIVDSIAKTASTLDTAVTTQEDIVIGGAGITIWCLLVTSLCRAIGCSLFRVDPEDSRDLILDSGFFVWFYASNVTGAAKSALGWLLNKRELVSYGLLVLFYAWILMDKAPSGERARLFLIMSALIMAASTGMFFHIVGGLVKAGLTKRGVNTFRSLLDEIVTCIVGASFMLLAGMRFSSVLLIVPSVLVPAALVKVIRRCNWTSPVH